MMTPALNAIIDCNPDAQITLLTSPEGKRLLRDFHPSIKAIWTWNRHGVLNPILDKHRLSRQIREASFDRIYCFDTSPRIAALFDHDRPGFHWFRGSGELMHSARCYLELVASTCDFDVERYKNFLPVNTAARQIVDQELAECGIGTSDLVVMMHPTFSGYSRFWIRKRQAKIRKLWPAPNYGELGRLLAQTKLEAGAAIRPLMVLLPGDMALGREIVKYSGNAITLLESKPDFDRYKAMISRADVMLTPDSGPMHVASALGTKIVAFFSMKEPADCGPYMAAEDFTILRSDDPVRGISTIDVSTVFDAVMAQLKRRVS